MKSGDVYTCTKCPDEHHTSELGSTSVDACVCSKGFRALNFSKCAGMSVAYFSICWHFNIYKLDEHNILEYQTSKILVSQCFSFFMRYTFVQSLMSAGRTLGSLGTPPPLSAKRRLLLDWVDAQCIGVVLIMHLRLCVIKIITFNGGLLIW